MGNYVKDTSVYRMKQTVAMLCAYFMKMLYDMDFWKYFSIKGKLWKLNVFFDTVVTVVLVSDFENIGVFSAVPMVVGTMMMFMTTMMNGDSQP